MSFGPEPGWEGYFTRHQADGAIPNGTRIIKVHDEPGDAHPRGALGTVLGSMVSPPEVAHLSEFAYFVEWDDMPYHAVAVVSAKIGVAP